MVSDCECDSSLDQAAMDIGRFHLHCCSILYVGLVFHKLLWFVLSENAWSIINRVAESLNTHLSDKV